MTLNTGDLAQLLVAVFFLLAAAHAVGHVFERLQQPKVVGEIIGGLLLGPSALGRVFPDFHASVFASGHATPWLLGAAAQLGQLLVLFCAGTELRLQFTAHERRTVFSLTTAGTLLPMLAGFMLPSFLGSEQLIGQAGNEVALALVSGVAVAVAAVPLIARVFLDLRIIDTTFARIVLATSVLSGIGLYALQSIAVGMVAHGTGGAVGLPAWLSIDSTSAIGIGYFAATTIVFFWAAMAVGPDLFRRVVASPHNVIRRANPIAFEILFLLAMTGLALVLGVAPLFGAFAAGFAAARASGNEAQRARDALRAFAFATFVPLYFAIIGLGLDLWNNFHLTSFLVVFAIACVVKATSVYAGARLSGETPAASRNFAVALNARGSIAIVLASVAHDARIISGGFFTTLVTLSIVTSMIAGLWLGAVVRRGNALR